MRETSIPTTESAFRPAASAHLRAVSLNTAVDSGLQPWQQTRLQSAERALHLGNEIAKLQGLAEKFAGDVPGLKDSLDKLVALKAVTDKTQAKFRDGKATIITVGKEKMGKSKLLTAMMNIDGLLPSEAERCTWSITSIEKSQDNGHSGTVAFYTRAEFADRIADLLKVFGKSASDWSDGMTTGTLNGWKDAYDNAHGNEAHDPKKDTFEVREAFQELSTIAGSWNAIKAKLGQPPMTITANDANALAENVRPFIALNDARNGNKPFSEVRAVKHVTLRAPQPELKPGVVLTDVPGVDATSPHARQATYGAIASDPDLVLFVNSVDRPSLVDADIEMIKQVRAANPDVPIRDRIVGMLTKADMNRAPDEHGHWHWKLAVKAMTDVGLLSKNIFVSSSVWKNNPGEAAGHPAAADINAYYGMQEGANGIDQANARIDDHLATELPRLDREAIERIETQLRAIKGEVVEQIKPAIAAHSPELKKEEALARRWEQKVPGQNPRGLLPQMRRAFDDYVQGDLAPERAAQRTAAVAKKVDALKASLLSGLTEAAAKQTRQQYGTRTGNSERSLVEHELRIQFVENLKAGLGDLTTSLSDAASKSMNDLLATMLAQSYDGGTLKKLLPEGQTVLEQLTKLGPATKPIVEDLKKAETKIRYIDMKVEDIVSEYYSALLATDPEDRKAQLDAVDERVKLMAYRRQAPSKAPVRKAEGSVVKRTASAIEDAAGAIEDAAAKFTLPIFGKVPLAKFIPVWRKYADATPKAAPVALREARKGWDPVLERMAKDVDRICTVLSGLYASSEGLPSHYESVLREVGEALLSKSGSQKLETWMRANAAKVWPDLGQFAEEAQTQLADLETLTNE